MSNMFRATRTGLRFSILILLLGLLVSGNSLLAEEAENQIAVLNLPGKGGSALRASKIEVRELVVVVIDQSGKRSAWQKDFLVGMAPLFPATEDNITSDTATQAIQKFEQLLRAAGGKVDEVEREQAKWKNYLSDLEAKQEEEKAQKKEKMEAAFETFTARQYDPSEKYTEETLLSIAEQAKNLMGIMPEKAQEIETFLEPWLQHAKYIDEGRIYLDGKWVSPQELRERRQNRLKEAMDAFMEEGISLYMESVVVPQSSVLLTLGGMIFTLVLIVYIFLWLASSRGGNLTFGGAIFLLFGLAVLGAYGYFGFKVFSGPTTIEQAMVPLADSSEGQAVLTRALFLASEPKDYEIGKNELQIQLQDSQLNQFFKDHLKFVRQGESELFDMERVGFACLFFDDHVMIFDEVIVFGKSFLIRYRLDHQIDSEHIHFTGFNVFFGGAQLPNQLAGHFWINLREDLVKLIGISKIAEIYQIGDIQDQILTLTLMRTPEKAEALETE